MRNKKAHVRITKEAIEYFNNLTTLLYEKHYFSYKENAIKYVLGLLDNIEKDLPSQPKKLAPRYFERYGKDLFYATFRVNKHTHWYVFFNVYQKENGTIFLVKYISNNHVIAQYL